MINSDENIKQSKRMRFHRSREDRIISGFCGGLAEYFDIDPVLIRLGFIAVFFFTAGVVIFYIIGAMVTPLEKSA